MMSFRRGHCRIKLLPSKENSCLCCCCQTYSLEEVTWNSGCSCGWLRQGQFWIPLSVIPSLQVYVRHIFECALLWSFIFFFRRALLLTCRLWRTWEYLHDVRLGYWLLGGAGWTVRLVLKGYNAGLKTIMEQNGTSFVILDSQSPSSLSLETAL